MISAYIRDLKKHLSRNDVTEHTYRPAVASLFKGLGLHAINEPKRTACGAPDFKVEGSHGNLVGHIECKQVGDPLANTAKSEQLGRYRKALPNLLLTDHLKWHWFVDGKPRRTCRIGTMQDGTFIVDSDGVTSLEGLLHDFARHKVVPPTTANDFAAALAHKARLARLQISTALAEKDSSFGHLHGIFQKHVKNDMDSAEFADVMAQTLTYGLFTQWVEGGKVPRAMPFLRTFLKGIVRSSEDAVGDDHLDIEWVIEGIKGLLETTPRTVLDGFGDGTGLVDPVLHFYEDFLNTYDKEQRTARGVWYTPQPIVDHIVDQIDLKLRTELGKADGLADPSVHILDPACGTGTFLHAVLRKIHSTLGTADFQRNIGSILGRIYGFELMMAPYAIAHLSLLRNVRSLGAKVPTGGRFKVYLTDTLADPKGWKAKGHVTVVTDMFGITSLEKAIQAEAEGAHKVKTNKPVMVVLGNPPYNGKSTNKGEWITGLVGDYKQGLEGERQVRALQDDYVKFWRFASQMIEKSGGCGGIVGFISPHGWYDAPTFRGMRKHMLDTFDQLTVLDLHGNTNKKEKTPADRVAAVGKDKNVFNIRQGVGITIAVAMQHPGKVAERKVTWGELWGGRASKFQRLSKATYQDIKPSDPLYLLGPTVVTNTVYDAGWSVKDIFPLNSCGVSTGRDAFVIDTDKTVLDSRLRDFSDLQKSDTEIRTKYGLKDNRDWSMSEARKRTAAEGVREDLLIPIMYRPLDTRTIYFSKREIDRPLAEVMQHLLDPNSGNLGLLTCRQQSKVGFQHVGVSNTANESGAVSNRSRERTYTFPLYLLPAASEDEGGLSSFLPVSASPTPNLSDGFIKAFSKATGLSYDPACPKTAGDDFKTSWTPLDLLHYIYGLMHDPAYREDYAEFLKRDYPKILLPTLETLDKARIYRALGQTLVDLHLPDRWAGNRALARTALTVATLTMGTDTVDHPPKWKDGKVFINKLQYFEGVTEAVWTHRIGGYQPAQKWLKDRKGRKLTGDDVLHYRRLCQVLAETAKLMGTLEGAE